MCAPSIVEQNNRGGQGGGDSVNAAITSAGPCGVWYNECHPWECVVILDDSMSAEMRCCDVLLFAESILEVVRGS